MGSVINSNKISRRKSYFSIKKIAFSIQTKFYLKSSNKKPKFNSIQKHLNMFGKIATLSAIGAATAWDLSLSSNTTWAANDSGDQAGGIFFFNNVGGSWFNGTGSCTVSAGDGINFINGHGLFVSEYQGGNSWEFFNLRDADAAEIGFTVFTDNAEAPAEDFLSVSCDNANALSDGDLKAGVWSDFVLGFPAGNKPANLTFDDPSIVVGEEVNGAYTITANGAAAQDLWFSVEFSDE